MSGAMENGAQRQLSGRYVEAPRSARAENADGHSASPAGQMTPGSATLAGQPVLRRKFFDQSLQEWTAKFRKNRQIMENLNRECDVLKTEVAKEQRDVDSLELEWRELEDRLDVETQAKNTELKAALETALSQKNMLQFQLSENRRNKAHLLKEKRLIQSDLDRKTAERIRAFEARDKLEFQIYQLQQSLAQIATERKKLEREVGLVQQNLRQHTELAEEVHTEVEHLCDGIKESIESQAFVPFDVVEAR